MCLGNKQQLRYGAKEVEKERYECTFECFRCEQYRVLAHAAVVRSMRGSTRARRKMLAAVNDYNKSRDEYSKMLRVSIEEIEPSLLIEKLTSNDVRPLTEIQNFAYFRELIQVNDEHDVGERLGSVEMEVIRSRLNQYISYVSNGMAPYTEGDLDAALSDAQVLINQLVNPINVNQQINATGGSLIAAVQGFDFINNKNTLLYINSIQIAAGIIKSNGSKRKRAHRRLQVLVDELSGVRSALGSIEVEQFSENVRFVLNERSKDNPNLSDEDRFRIKEEIVDFVERYPVDTGMLRDEIARDFIKFIDDVGGTPKRVIISSLALDDMVF